MANRNKHLQNRLVVNTFKNPTLGRRTGTDVIAGKVIRKDERGVERFEDYFTDESQTSLCDSVTASPKVAFHSQMSMYKSVTLSKYVLTNMSGNYFPQPMSPFSNDSTLGSDGARTPLRSISIQVTPTDSSGIGQSISPNASSLAKISTDLRMPLESSLRSEPGKRETVVGRSKISNTENGHLPAVAIQPIQNGIIAASPRVASLTSNSISGISVSRTPSASFPSKKRTTCLPSTGFDRKSTSTPNDAKRYREKAVPEASVNGSLAGSTSNGSRTSASEKKKISLTALIMPSKMANNILASSNHNTSNKIAVQQVPSESHSDADQTLSSDNDEFDYGETPKRFIVRIDDDQKKKLGRKPVPKLQQETNEDTGSGYDSSEDASTTKLLKEKPKAVRGKRKEHNETKRKSTKTGDTNVTRSTSASHPQNARTEVNGTELNPKVANKTKPPDDINSVVPAGDCSPVVISSDSQEQFTGEANDCVVSEMSSETDLLEVADQEQSFAMQKHATTTPRQPNPPLKPKALIQSFALDREDEREAQDILTQDSHGSVKCKEVVPKSKQVPSINPSSQSSVSGMANIQALKKRSSQYSSKHNSDDEGVPNLELDGPVEMVSDTDDYSIDVQDYSGKLSVSQNFTPESAVPVRSNKLDQSIVRVKGKLKTCKSQINRTHSVTSDEEVDTRNSRCGKRGKSSMGMKQRRNFEMSPDSPRTNSRKKSKGKGRSEVLIQKQKSRGKKRSEKFIDFSSGSSPGEISGFDSTLRASGLDDSVNETYSYRPVKNVKYRSSAPIRKSILKSEERKETVRKRGVIEPTDSTDGHCRRSKRKRVLPVSFWAGEKVKYRYSSSGQEITGIHRADDDSGDCMENNSLSSRRPEVSFNETVGVASYNNYCNETSSTSLVDLPAQALPLLNPETQEEVLVDCVAFKVGNDYTGSEDGKAAEGQQYKICKNLRQRAFHHGSIVIFPNGHKPKERVGLNTLVFNVTKGMVLVTLYKSQFLAKIGDSFFVATGNTYSLRNTQPKPAELTFTQIRGPDSSSE